MAALGRGPISRTSWLGRSDGGGVGGRVGCAGFVSAGVTGFVSAMMTSDGFRGPFDSATDCATRYTATVQSSRPFLVLWRQTPGRGTVGRWAGSYG